MGRTSYGFRLQSIGTNSMARLKESGGTFKFITLPVCRGK
jgi:hypothetical protein